VVIIYPLLLVLAGVGFWFYQVYFASTVTALQRAEAFLFRRMQVAQLGQQGEYRFFFVTNRRAERDAGPLEERFGTEREEALKFGFFDVKIEPALGLGMLVNPTEWFQNEEIKLKAVRELDQEAFTEQLRAIVDASPQRSLLVVVHGFREAFPSALRKTTFIGHVLDINSPVLLFDWPGNQGSTPNGYRRARQVAKESAPDLARGLELTIQDIRPERLWLIANSMGAQVAVDAIRLLSDQATWPMRNPPSRMSFDRTGRRLPRVQRNVPGRAGSPCPKNHGLRLLQRPGPACQPAPESESAAWGKHPEPPIEPDGPAGHRP
jgi:esterase/lipase superfamily enzyme